MEQSDIEVPAAGERVAACGRDVLGDGVGYTRAADAHPFILRGARVWLVVGLEVSLQPSLLRARRADARSAGSYALLAGKSPACCL